MILPTSTLIHRQTDQQSAWILGGSRVKMEQAWRWCLLFQPVWGDPGFPAMWLLLHGDTDHAYLPRGKLLSGSKVPGAMGKGSLLLF